MPLTLSAYNQRLFDEAQKQAKLCEDWLLSLMAQSHEKPATKEVLRNEAMRRWGVSKRAFDSAWIGAIEKTGNHHWYEPLLGRKRNRGGFKN